MKLTQTDITDSTDNRDKWPGQCVSETEFQRAQQSDSTLQSCWVRARTNSNEFVIFDGILYKKIPGHILSEHEYSLVVPSEYHDQLLNMAHNSKAGAHLGVRKTLDRIQSVFFFPRIRQKIKDHIKACRECQLTAPTLKNERQSDDQSAAIYDKYSDVFSTTSNKTDILQYKWTDDEPMFQASDNIRDALRHNAVCMTRRLHERGIT